MAEYLVGILYHEPEPYRLWQAGKIEDFESSTGLFVEAPDAASAVAWGEQVAQALLVHANDDPALDWRALGYRCWVVDDPASSDWKHCLAFFPRVAIGTMSPVEQMTSPAYERWSASRPDRVAATTPDRPSELFRRTARKVLSALGLQ